MSITDITPPGNNMLALATGPSMRSTGQPFDQVLDKQLELSAAPAARQGPAASASPGTQAIAPQERASAVMPDDLLALLGQARAPAGPTASETGSLPASVTQPGRPPSPDGSKMTLRVIDPTPAAPMADSAGAIAADTLPLDLSRLQTPDTGPASVEAIAGSAPQASSPAAMDQAAIAPDRPGAHQGRIEQSSLALHAQTAGAQASTASGQRRLTANAPVTTDAQNVGAPAGDATLLAKLEGSADEASDTAGPRRQSGPNDAAEFPVTQASTAPWPFAPLPAQPTTQHGLARHDDGDEVYAGRAVRPDAASAPDSGELSASAARDLAGRAVRNDAARPVPDSAPATQAFTPPSSGRKPDGGPDGIAPTADRFMQPEPAAAVVQPAPAPLTSPTAHLQAEAHVQTPLHQTGWEQAIGQRVLWMAQDQLQSASLTLNPPHLGPVQITLQLDAQQANVQFVSAHAEVRQALQEALPVLRDLLGQAGIQLGQADVSSRQSRQGEQAFQETSQDKPMAAAQDPALAPELSTGTPLRGRGLVDLLA